MTACVNMGLFEGIDHSSFLADGEGFGKNFSSFLTESTGVLKKGE